MIQRDRRTPPLRRRGFRVLMATTVQKEVGEDLRSLCSHIRLSHLSDLINHLLRVAAVRWRAAAGCGVQIGHLAAVYRGPNLLSGVSARGHRDFVPAAGRP
jgi:hypothetical protein